MRDLNNTTLIANGITALLIQAVLSGLCYLVASIGARLISPLPRRIYIARLLFMVGFVVTWWLYHFATGQGNRGNALDPDFWYGVARNLGRDIGALMIWAWFIVAIIDRLKAKRAA
jgi:hypothetical protein